jgi:hypothetical protein
VRLSSDVDPPRPRVVARYELGLERDEASFGRGNVVKQTEEEGLKVTGRDGGGLVSLCVQKSEKKIFRVGISETGRS